MTERELVWLGIGVAIGYLVWEEFGSNQCTCNKKKKTGSSSSSSAGSNSSCKQCGGH